MPETDLAHVLAVFLARMAAGYALFLGVLGPRVTQGSWRHVSLFVLAGLALAALAAGAPLLPCLAAAGVALTVQRAIAYRLPVASSTLWMVPAGAWLLLATEWPPGLATFPSALATGGTLAAMLLGHSYLTARGLSYGPLQWMAWALFAVLVLRAATVTPAFFAEGVAPMDLVFLALRASLGLALPLVLGWMVVQCARIESNQSATGILYAMTVLVGVFGELIAVYLSVTRGIQA